jgi:hypothetical protein
MAPYIDYAEDRIPGRPGDAFDIALGKDDISLINANPQAAQVATVTITAVNTTLYTVTINGVSVTYTSDGSATQAEISAGLQAAILAEPAISGLVVASGTTTLIITSVSPGLPFTIAVGANLSAAATTANAEAAAVPFGRAIIRDSANAQGGRLVAAGAFTASSVVLTPAAVNTTLYRIVITVDGVPYQISYTSDGSATVQEIVEGLDAAIIAASVPNVASSEDNATLTIASVNGAAISVDYPAGLISAAVTQSAGLAELFAGVALRQDTEEPQSGVAAYAPNSTMSVRRKGRVRVQTEEQCNPGEPVYVRVAASGANTTIGVFRKSQGAGAVLLPGANWYKSESASRAILQL